MPSHYPSFDEHSSFLSKHYIFKSRVFSHIWFQVRHNQNMVYCILKFGILQEIWSTFRRLTPWRNPSKFVVLKHFGWNVLHKEYTTPFLFTIFMCALCRIWVWSMCRNLSGNTAENDGNTLWELNRAWRKPRDGICRYKTFWMRIFGRTPFLLLRCCSIHCVFWRHILLEIEFKSRDDMGSDSVAQRYHPWGGNPTFDTEKNNTEKLSEADL